MKRNFKKLTALLLALIMALSLCACGSSGKTNDTSSTVSANGGEETPEYVYNTEFQTIVSGIESSLYPRLFSANGFYALSYEIVGREDDGDSADGDAVPLAGDAAAETDGAETETKHYEEYRAKLSFVDFSGAVSELVNYAPVNAENENADKKDFYSSSDVSGMAETSDGKLVIIENVYSSWYDGPDGIDRNSDEYYEYQNYSNTYYIRVLDTDGSELSHARLEVGEDAYINAYNMFVDSNDNIVVTTDSSVRVIALDGTNVMEIDAAEDASQEYVYIDSALLLNDGRIAVTLWGGNAGGEELWIVDESQKAFTDKYVLPNGAYSVISGGGEYDLYYTNGSNFYGCKLGADDGVRLFNWINCDVNIDNVERVLVRDDGSAITVINDYDSVNETYDVSIATTSLVPYDSITHKETISFATQYLGWDVRSQIIAFNRKNDQYRIEVNDYSQYNTEEDYSAGITKLTTELLAGNIPDIIDLNSLPYTQLAAKGILEDLYPYIDADSEISREDFFANVLEALEVNGGLYSTCSSFSLITAIGAASVVGDEPGWTYEEFEAALASMPEGCEPFDSYTTRDTILQTCLNLDMKDYVNWSTGECNFNNEQFTKLLEFAARFPETFDWENYEYTPDDSTENRIAQGKQMLMMGSIYSIDDIFYNDMYFGGDATYIGFPTADGSAGNLIGTTGGYAMGATSTHKDAVWQFLRTFLTEKGQSDVYSIPTNLNAYKAKLKEAMTPQYEKDENGDYVLDENGERIEMSRGGFGTANGKTVEFYALTQEQADELYTAITSANTLNDYSQNSIFEIVSEQSQAYFAGQKTAEEVAKLVQSKANIYVNEQR